MDASFRAARRCMQEWAPHVPALAESGPSLETLPTAVEPPRVIASKVIEGHAIRARRVEGDPEVGFAAFLDGTQRSRVLGYHEGLPLVFGTAAAVVRVRVARRLYTWNRGPEVRHRVYLPCASVPATLVAHYGDRGYVVVDTTRPDGSGADSRPHPFALIERAVQHVREDREDVERTLAEAWCRLEGLPLCIDGGTSASELVAAAECAVGVVKSHRTLYADGEALARVLGLRRGERSSAFRLNPRHRESVASWYLRVRDPAGHDPMWGLVRVEAADLARRGERPEDLTARADRISRWILAEATPLSLPDGRWDKMLYGIRDCEEFLRAVC
jgi:hypothetical protein